MTNRPRKQLEVSAADSENIDRLIKLAGSERELNRLTKIMRQRRASRPPGSRFDDYDTEVLSIAQYAVRAKGESFRAVVKKIINSENGPLRWKGRGANSEAVVSRIYQKRQNELVAFNEMTKEEQDKWERETLDWFDWIDSLDDPLRTDLQTNILKMLKVFSAKAAPLK
jgi:hypothetical protein